MTEQKHIFSLDPTDPEDIRDTFETVDITETNSLVEVPTKLTGDSSSFGGEEIARVYLGGTHDRGQEYPAEELAVVSVHHQADPSYSRLAEGYKHLTGKNGTETLVLYLGSQGKLQAYTFISNGGFDSLGREGTVRWIDSQGFGGNFKEIRPFEDNNSISRRHLVMHRTTDGRSLTIMQTSKAIEEDKLPARTEVKAGRILRVFPER